MDSIQEKLKYEVIPVLSNLISSYVIELESAIENEDVVNQIRLETIIDQLRSKVDEIVTICS